MNKTVEVWGYDFNVEFDGEPYQPATWHEPQSGGEVEITAIYLGGVEVGEILDPKVVDAIEAELYYYVNGDYERDMKLEAAEAHWESRRDEERMAA